MRKAYWKIPLCLFFILFSNYVYAFQDNLDYRLKLVDAAISQRLYDDRYWNILLHYRPTSEGRESIIDDSSFFLASDGKSNPVSELTATIDALFAPSVPGEKHPQCRFPARYNWIRRALHIDDGKLQSIKCHDNIETLSRVNPLSSVLIFASPSFSGSSKIFGHTLLRIDSDNEDSLLSYAVNYAAHTTDEIDVGYIVKGLTGQFRGYFSMLPYHLKIREYSDLENRDIWEYYLNLDEEETYRMVLHIQELQNIFSDYYFLDENCSFNILFLIEAGRPSLHLTDSYWSSWGYGVIPLDTIAVVAKSGIVSRVLYRPSPVTQIRHLAQQLDKLEQEAAKNIAINGLSPEIMESSRIRAQKKWQTIELAGEYLKYRYSRMELSQERFQENFLQIMDLKKQIADETSPKVFEQLPPELRHNPAKIKFGIGYREESPFAEITFRPAYRDLLEIADNSHEAVQVRILEISGRYYEKGSTIKLQDATLLDILSISARDMFFQPYSWKLQTGLKQNLFPSGNEDVAFQFDAGGGWSFSNPMWGLFYSLIEADMKLSSRFNDNIAFGPGVTLGVLKKVTENWIIGLQCQGTFYELGENYRSYKCGFDQRIQITKSNAIILSYETEKADTELRTEIKIGWSYFF